MSLYAAVLIHLISHCISSIPHAWNRIPASRSHALLVDRERAYPRGRRDARRYFATSSFTCSSLTSIDHECFVFIHILALFAFFLHAICINSGYLLLSPFHFWPEIACQWLSCSSERLLLVVSCTLLQTVSFCVDNVIGLLDLSSVSSSSSHQRKSSWNNWELNILA